jgi:hypothetical protein
MEKRTIPGLSKSNNCHRRLIASMNGFGKSTSMWQLTVTSREVLMTTAGAVFFKMICLSKTKTRKTGILNYYTPMFRNLSLLRRKCKVLLKSMHSARNN